MILFICINSCFAFVEPCFLNVRFLKGEKIGMMTLWNPWHGCRKISAGCQNCYVYSRDSEFEKDSSMVLKNADFDLPVLLKRDGTYKLCPESGFVATCLTSDFFIEEADGWRDECWAMMKKRFDLDFFIITKRICRFDKCIPSDWGDGYPNVIIGCTVENDEQAKIRLPIFLKSKIKNKVIVCAPLISNINLLPYLNSSISEVSVGGESGKNARVCDFSWVLNIKRQCDSAGIRFTFHQTGALLKKDGVLYRIPRNKQHSQAKKAGLDT